MWTTALRGADISWAPDQNCSGRPSLEVVRDVEAAGTVDLGEPRTPDAGPALALDAVPRAGNRAQGGRQFPIRKIRGD